VRWRNIEQFGRRKVEKFKELSGLDFVENEVRVVVFEGISNSGVVNVSPMKLRASYDYDHKKAALTHELGHRLLFGNKIKKEGLGMHQLLDLVLYDLWVDIWGKQFADVQVKRESDRCLPSVSHPAKAPYKECWEWALAMSREERQEQIKLIFIL